MPNVPALVEAVGARSHLPFDEGLKQERELLPLAHRRRALQGAAPCLLRRARGRQGAGRRAGGTSRARSERVAVIGAGTMGGGIAMCFANAGIPVTLIETGEEQLERGIGRIGEELRHRRARRLPTPEAPAKRMALINRQVGLATSAGADIVIEAVFEDMGVKKEIFGELDQVAKPGAILACNTSYLDIDEIAAATKRPQDVLGMHFFSPANVMKLLRDRAWRKDRAGRAGDRGGDRAQDRARYRSWSASATASSATACWSSAAAVGTAADRGRAAAAGRCGRDRVRLHDGSVRHGRPRRPRHRLALAQGPRHEVGDRGRAVRSRPFRPEDRQGLLQIRGRLARPAARSRGREADRRDPDAARPQARAW